MLLIKVSAKLKVKYFLVRYFSYTQNVRHYIMKKTTNYIWFAILFLISCNAEKKSYSGLVFPDYIDTLSFKGIDYVVDEMSICYHHIQYVDTLNFASQLIDLNRQLEYGAYRYQSFEGYPWPKGPIKIEILIDTARIIPTKDNNFTRIPPPPPPTIIDSELVPDFFDYSDTIENTEKSINLEYKKSPWINNYPVFIVNYSDTIISLTYGAISGFPMIQEAKDSIGNWKPIQYWHWDWCGNTYSSIDLKPNHYALTRTPKFSGDFKTKLRLKLRFFNVYFYSKEYNGSINYSQFAFPERLDFFEKREREYMLLTE